MPETRHERLPGSEFAFLKRNAAYTIVLDAEAEGSVDLKVRVLDNGGNTRTAVYLGVPLRAHGHAQLQLKPGTGRAAAPQGWPELEIDADGDGVSETRLPATAVLDERTSADITAPELVIDTPSANGAVAGPTSVRWRAADSEAGLLREEAILDPDTTTPRVVTNGQTMVLAPDRTACVSWRWIRPGTQAARRLPLPCSRLSTEEQRLAASVRLQRRAAAHHELSRTSNCCCD